LTVHIKDGTPVLPVPYFLFNSNDGLSAGAIVLLPNAGGSLQGLQVVGIYNAYPDKDNDLQWSNPNFEFNLGWAGFRTGRFTFSAMLQAIRTNEQIVDRGETYLLAQSLKFTTGVRGTYRIFDTLKNTFGVSITGTPQTETIQVIDPHYYLYGQQKMNVQLGNTLTYDKVNWQGNFRQGINSNLAITEDLNWPYYADFWGSFGAQADIAGYHILNSFLNPSARISLVYGSNHALLKMGKPTRGIIDTELTGNLGVFVNTGLQIKLFRIGKTEFHLTPTADFAFVYATDGHPDPAATGFGVGAEFTIMDDRIRGFPIKLGAGYDLRPGIENARRLEVDINFQLFY
jgi:hypothetical protein